jgi:hypothetical protein
MFFSKKKKTTYFFHNFWKIVFFFENVRVRSFFQQYDTKMNQMHVKCDQNMVSVDIWTVYIIWNILLEPNYCMGQHTTDFLSFLSSPPPPRPPPPLNFLVFELRKSPGYQKCLKMFKVFEFFGFESKFSKDTF